MFFTAKKLISSLFLAISLLSVLLLLPFETRAQLDGESEGTQAQNDPNDPAYTGAAQETGTTPTAQAEIADTVTFGCDMWTGTGLLNCLLDIEYGVLVGVSRNLFKLAGHIFDTIWAFGLSSDSYKQDDFIGAGWIVCRDISNTFFIFILLYIAITTILQVGSTKQLLSTVIIVALLMNFSLYITRFVIDIGNMFALEFYSTFPEDKHPAVIIPGIERHSIANGYQNALIVPLLAVANGIPGQGGKEAFAVKAAMIALVGIEFLVVTFVFLIVSFLLIGRLATLWIVMIVSPLAFFSIALPSGVSGASGIWGQWKSHLVSQTFFPAIFLFFMYFAARLANGSSSYVLATFGHSTEKGVSIFIPLAIQFAIIIFFIMKGLSIATGMSGQAGQMAAKYGKIGTGLAGGAMLGATAWTSRQTLGRLANQAMADRESGGLGWGKSLSTSKWGRPVLSGLNAVSTGTLDVRSTGIGGIVRGKTGIDFGTPGGKGGFVSGKESTIQENLKKYQSQYDALKGDPVAQAKYVASLGSVVSGDRDAFAMWSKIPANDRQKLIDKASEGKDKDYLKELNTKLAIGGTSEVRGIKSKEDVTTELKNQADALKDKPDEQFKFFEQLIPNEITEEVESLKDKTQEERDEFFKNLSKSGKTERLASLMKGLSTKERYNFITKTEGNSRTYLEQIEKERKAKLKPDQLKTEDKEWRGEEFNAALKNYKEAKKAAEEAGEKGDAAEEAVQKEKIEKHAQEVKESLQTKLEREQVAALSSEDLLTDAVVRNISVSQLKSIEKISGHKFKDNQEKDFYKDLDENNKDPEIVSYRKDSPIKKTKEKRAAPEETSGEIYIPTSNLSNEIGSARASQNQSPRR